MLATPETGALGLPRGQTDTPAPQRLKAEVLLITEKAAIEYGSVAEAKQEFRRMGYFLRSATATIIFAKDLPQEDAAQGMYAQIVPKLKP